MKTVICPACGLPSEVRDLPDNKWTLCRCGEKIFVPGRPVKPDSAPGNRPKIPWYMTEVPWRYIVLGLLALGGVLCVAYRLHVVSLERAEEQRRINQWGTTP